MKPIIPLSFVLLVLMAGCAAPQPLTADKEASKTALAAYRACAWRTLEPLRGAKQDAAIDVATVAARGCKVQLQEVHGAVLADNADNSFANAFATGFASSAEKNAINTMAAAIMKQRAAQP